MDWIEIHKTVNSTHTLLYLSHKYIRIKTADLADALMVYGFERMWKTPKQFWHGKLKERVIIYAEIYLLPTHNRSIHTYTRCVPYILYIVRKSQFSRSPPGKNKRDIFTRQIFTLYTLCFHSCRVVPMCAYSIHTCTREGECVHICAVQYIAMKSNALCQAHSHSS